MCNTSFDTQEEAQTALDFSVKQMREVIKCVKYYDIRRRVECEMLEYSTTTIMQKPDLSTSFPDINPFTGLHYAAKVLQRALQSDCKRIACTILKDYSHI